MGSQTRTAERERVVQRAGARASRLFRHRRRLEKLSYPYDESARVNERDSVGHFEKFVPKMCWMDLWHCRLHGMKRCSPSYRSGGRRRRSYFCLFPAPFRIPRRRRCSASAEALQRNAPGFFGCTRLNCGPSHAMGVRSNRVYPLPKSPCVRSLPSSWKAFPIAHNFAHIRGGEMRLELFGRVRSTAHVQHQKVYVVALRGTGFCRRCRCKRRCRCNTTQLVSTGCRGTGCRQYETCHDALWYRGHLADDATQRVLHLPLFERGCMAQLNGQIQCGLSREHGGLDDVYFITGIVATCHQRESVLISF